MISPQFQTRVRPQLRQDQLRNWGCVGGIGVDARLQRWQD